MLKKMRWRFIGAAMSAFLAVILVLLCVINIWNYRNVTKQQDQTLQTLLEQEKFDRDPPGSQGKPPVDTMDKFSPEVPYMIRFFSVEFSATGEAIRVNQDYIASISKSDALIYATTAMETGRNSGYYQGYRYLISRTDHGSNVLFLNSEKELQAVQSLACITVAIALGSLGVVFVLVVLFSKRAIAPYVRNLETQKQFITNASHELKTPLTAISTSADVLAMEHEEDEWVRNIQTQTGRLSRLVSNLVTLSRLDEENPFPARVEFSLSEALWEISEPYVSMAQAKGMAYTQQIDEGLTCVGDRAAIQQMISILLDNAMKYTIPGGNICLKAEKEGKHPVITVENTCDPTKQLDVTRLFERFYRGDESHSGKVGGTGIGLSIAQATAHAHGGEITAVQENACMCFRVQL